MTSYDAILTMAACMPVVYGETDTDYSSMSNPRSTYCYNFILICCHHSALQTPAAKYVFNSRVDVSTGR